jgi:hypothetical protein
MSTLDEFFREKLADHSITPSDGAWQRVQAGLSKKNNGLIWLRWAAAVLLGALLLGALWIQRETEPQMAQEKKEEPKQPEVKKELLPPPVAETVAETKVRTNQPADKRTGQKTRKKILPSPQDESPKKDFVESREVTQLEQEQVPLQEEVKQATDVGTTTPQTSRAIVLTYTLDPVIASTNEKEEAGANPVAETDKNSKGLKRMIDLANEVKNSDSPLGELRLKKSELFALFLKKKPTSKKQ